MIPLGDEHDTEGVIMGPARVARPIPKIERFDKARRVRTAREDEKKSRRW